MEFTKLYNFDLKAADLKDGEFQGHCAIFNNVDLQGDRIRRNAFAATIEESGGRWPVLMGHNTGRVVGFSTHAEEDSKGLFVTGQFTLASDEGRNAHATCLHAASLQQKFGLSIGYMIPKDGADFDADTGVRTLKAVQVLEFSLASVPANPRARITHVKELGECKSVREVEAWLREHGATGDDARTMISILRQERDANAAGDPERDAKEAEGRALNAFLVEVREFERYQDLKRTGVI